MLLIESKIELYLRKEKIGDRSQMSHSNIYNYDKINHHTNNTLQETQKKIYNLQEGVSYRYNKGHVKVSTMTQATTNEIE